MKIQSEIMNSYNPHGSMSNLITVDLSLLCQFLFTVTNERMISVDEKTRFCDQTCVKTENANKCRLQ